MNTDRPQQAEEYHQRALELRQKLVDDSPQDWLLVTNLGLSHESLAWFLGSTGRLAEAEKAHRDSLAIRERLAAEFPNTPVAHLLLARTLKDLSELLSMTGRPQESLEAYRRAVAIYEKLAILDPALTFRQVRLAWVLATHPDPHAREPARAVELARNSLDNEELGSSDWIILGAAYYRAGNWKAAKDALAHSKVLWADDEMRCSERFFTAMVYWQLGEESKARESYAEAIEQMDKQIPNDGLLRRVRAEAEELLIRGGKPSSNGEPPAKNS